eukprot:UN09211
MNVAVAVPTNISKSTSHTIGTPQHTPTHRRHNSLEILQAGSQVQSAGSGRSANASMGTFHQSRNSRSKRRHNNNNIPPRNM